MSATDPRLPGTRFLHSPGPTHLPEAVLQAMHRQPLDLADPRLDAVIARCERGLRGMIGTADAQLVMYASNGHGAWEAVVQNLIAPGEQILLPGTGHFSESWGLQSEALGAEVRRLPWNEGRPVDPAEVAQALRDDRAGRIAAVFLVHTDTASGVTSDIDAVRAAIDETGHRALLVVDAVASLAAAPLAMDAQRIDVLVGASQKGLMLPPGLAFVALNRAAAEQAAHNPRPRFYWDWGRRDGAESYRKFCGTPPQHLLFGLEASLRLIEAEGLPAVHARHRSLAGAVQAAVATWAQGGALDFFCDVPSARSVSVTTIRTAEGVDPDAIRRVAREDFSVAVAGGLGPLQGRAFRIGHLGDLSVPMVLGALGGVQAALARLGLPYRAPDGRDGVSAAADFIARAASGTSAGPL